MLVLFLLGAAALCALFGLFTLRAFALLMHLRPWRDRIATLRRLGFTLTWGGVTAGLWGLVVSFEETGMGHQPAPEGSVSGLWQTAGACLILAGVGMVLWALARWHLNVKDQ